MSTKAADSRLLSSLKRPSHLPIAKSSDESLRIQTILVPIDLSEESYRALGFALPLAKRFDASVHALHVYEGARQLSSIATGPVLFSDTEIARLIGKEVGRRYGASRSTLNCHIRSGAAFHEIAAAAEEMKADLIVIATHGKGGLKHLMLGSTAEKTVRHAPCPVLVVRQGSRGPIRTATEGIVLEKILVPVDFSECARAGARYAARFASKVGADLLLMNVTHVADFTASDPNVIPPEGWQLVEAARLTAEDQLDELVNSLPLIGISAETEAAVGTPVDELINRTRKPDIDMVITSTHGYTGLRHVLLGSTAEQLVRRADCPVLVVPSHDRRPDIGSLPGHEL